MKIKVCGLTDAENIQSIVNLSIDFVGFIFYPNSLRNIKLTEKLKVTILDINTTKVGVFVNDEILNIQQISKTLKLDYVQLHGNENVKFCKSVNVFSKVIKVFKITDCFDFSICKKFQFVDYFLFETKGKLAGGNGTQFDWGLLREYNLDVPFFLSGGISLKDIESIKQLKLKQLKVVDLNSGFEIKPGLKNIELLKQFKHELSNK